MGVRESDEIPIRLKDFYILEGKRPHCQSCNPQAQTFTGLLLRNLNQATVKGNAAIYYIPILW